MTRVYYHHPDDKRFSLSYVSPDFDVIEDKAESNSGEETKIEEYDLDQCIYALYSASPELGAAEDLEYDVEGLVDEMEQADGVITARILRLFRSIIEQTFEEEEKRLEAYKQVEVDDIPDALSYVDWSGTVAEVGGSLFSNLVLAHTLPNANHRTSLALLELYIQAHEYRFTLPDVATDDFKWQTWVNNFIRDSKRILTVRRNNLTFHYLWKYGCNEVERKDGITIHLKNYELGMLNHEAYRKYADRHRECCTEMTEEILCQEGYDELLDEPGLGKQQFAERLEEMR